MKIRILYIVSSLKKCGPTTVLKNIIEGLNREEFEISILSLKTTTENNYEKYLASIGVKLYNLNSNKFNWIIKAKFFLNKNENRYDLIHSHSERADFINFFLVSNPKKISTLHNFPSEDLILSYGKIKGKILVMLYEQFLKKIPYICCGEELSFKIQKKNNLKIQFINNGIDTKLFSPITIEKKLNLRRKLNLNLSEKYFIVTSAIISRKNLEIILNVFSKNQKKILILGDGNLLNGYVNKYKSFSNIEFLGNKNNVEEYLQASDCYISMSLSEGLPNSVLEALSVGLSVILSDIPQHRQIIKNTNNILVDKNSEIELEQSVEKIISNEELKIKNIELINKNYSKELMSQKYREKYLELVN